VKKKLVWGMRYMDDLYTLFFYHTKREKSKLTAEELKNDFQQNCYHKKWNLKNVDNNIFLSSEISWKNNELNIRWANKNKDTVLNERKQKIIRFVHVKSNTAEIIKINSIYSQFLRVARNSDRKNVLKDFDELSEEYQILGYRKANINVQREKVIEKMK
jgi:hypothetical protein